MSAPGFRPKQVEATLGCPDSAGRNVFRADELGLRRPSWRRRDVAAVFDQPRGRPRPPVSRPIDPANAPNGGTRRPAIGACADSCMDLYRLAGRCRGRTNPPPPRRPPVRVTRCPAQPCAPRRRNATTARATAYIAAVDRTCFAAAGPQRGRRASPGRMRQGIRCGSPSASRDEIPPVPQTIHQGSRRGSRTGARGRLAARASAARPWKGPACNGRAAAPQAAVRLRKKRRVLPDRLKSFRSHPNGCVARQRPPSVAGASVPGARTGSRTPLATRPD